MQFNFKVDPLNVGNFLKNPVKFLKMVASYSKRWAVPKNFGKFQISC